MIGPVRIEAAALAPGFALENPPSGKGDGTIGGALGRPVVSELVAAVGRNWQNQVGAHQFGQVSRVGAGAHLVNRVIDRDQIIEDMGCANAPGPALANGARKFLCSLRLMPSYLGDEQPWGLGAVEAVAERSAHAAGSGIDADAGGPVAWAEQVVDFVGVEMAKAALQLVVAHQMQIRPRRQGARRLDDDAMDAGTPDMA